jgi:PIN domain nuclease of toxin-antitoxin system
MRVLLDTHALLWILAGDARLSAAAQRLYGEAEDVQFSVVSLWEIGIKLGLQRLDFRLADGWWQDIPRAMVAQGAGRLDVEPEHCRTVAELPLHHRDPFDRMLIAQALCTDCEILSADDKFDAYGVRRPGAGTGVP